MTIAKSAILSIALVFVLFPYMLAQGESDYGIVEATGLVLFEDSPNSGLWAAEADFYSHRGDVITVYQNDASDIFIVTIKGDDIAFEEDELIISGIGFITKNGVLLEEGDGNSTMNKNGMELKINGNIVVTGQTISFTKN